MIFVSFPKIKLKETPAVVVDRLRSNWVNPGVYLILEGVILQIHDENGQPIPSETEEHILIGFEGDHSLLSELIRTTEALRLGKPTLWEDSNVFATVEDAATFYLKAGTPEIAADIHQRFADALPDSYIAWSNAGRFFLKLERPHMARPYLFRAYALAPDVPEVAINYLVLLYMEGKKEEADALREENARKYPDHPAFAD